MNGKFPTGMNPPNPIPFILMLAFSAWSTVLAQGGNPRFKIEADVIGGLSGESNSTRFSNFGVNEPISGLSLKNLPDIENFAGFAGQIVALDQDMDGLPDHQEIALGTDKTKPDTDGDGLTDKEEVDSGTNPLLADTDGDGYSDMAEINANTNPLLSSSNPNQAPTDLNTTAPLTLAENQPVGTFVGEFNGTDPDVNSTLVYFLAPGNGDHNNSLFSLDTNGTLTSQVVFDFESNASAYSLLVGVKDEYNASLEKSFTVSLTNVIEDLDGDGIEDAIDPDMDGDGFSNTVELAYGSDPLDSNSRANQSPTNLELNGNTISENQAMGTEIGVFSALDTDTHSVLSFMFLNGSGESNNSLFTLEQNGTLTSAVIFDYESTASPLTIHVRASDEYNASTEGNFTINLTNVFEDFDGDGIEDAIDPDTDGDGFSNTVEMAQGTDPLDPASIPNALPVVTWPTTELTIEENKPVGTVVTIFQASDPDGDALAFAISPPPSLMVDPTGPYTPYWDQNAFELGVDGKLQSKIIFDYEGQKFYDLKIIVSDEKGGQVKKDFRITVTNDIWDDPEVIAQMDDDQDGLSNGNEEFLGTDRNNPDTDGDGWLDGAEFEAQSNPLVADSDGDGLNDFEEHNRGTDPMQADTDGDGYNDKDEIDAGTLPEDRLDYPGAPDFRGDSTANYDSPDGRRYEIHYHTRGKIWPRARNFATKLGGSLPEVEGNDALMSYLQNLMLSHGVETESESLGLIGAWVGSADGSTAMLDMDGDPSFGDADENDRLAVIIAFEKPIVLRPAVLTINPQIAGEYVQAKARILDQGGETPYRVGFRISEKIMIRESDSTARTISAILSGDLFETQIERLTPGKTYYIRAFAENSAGLQYGSVRRIKVEKTYTAPFDAQPLADNWYQSDWFGTFNHANAEWIFHQELGWLYHGPVGQNGIWFWSEEMKWVWTRKDLWPYLWNQDEGGWLYYMGIIEAKRTFWNFSNTTVIQW